MSEFARDRLDFDDEDRLPWLEPATGFDELEERISPLRLLLVILAVLAVLGLGAVGVVGLRHYFDGSGGEGKLIAAPAENYKIPAAQADAKKFAGEGDASYATSEGVQREGRIDMSREPEAPVAATPLTGTTGSQNPANGAMQAQPEARMTTRVANATKPGKAIRSAISSGEAMVQLGAYGSAAVARESWGKLAKRYAYLAPLSTSVEAVNVGSTTLYRLRAKAQEGVSASTLCGKLKAAGENCMVVN